MKKATLGSCIRSLRLQGRMTQSQLARKLGVTDKAVSKWERDISYPDITLFPKLAGILGVTVNDLFSDCIEDCHPFRILQTLEVSRDIRMPLHIILGFVEIARLNHDDPQLLLKYLEGIRVSGEYLMTVLNCAMQEDCCSEGQEGKDGRDLPCQDMAASLQGLENYVLEKAGSDSQPEEQEDYDFSGKRILVVDDMAVNREIASEVLRQTNAGIDIAQDGLECLQKIEDMPDDYYDLVLMDLIMPVMGGLEATRRIRQLPAPKGQIPVVAMTTNVSDRESAFAAGMNAFTQKPILVNKLLAVISQFLAHKE